MPLHVKLAQLPPISMACVCAVTGGHCEPCTTASDTARATGGIRHL